MHYPSKQEHPRLSQAEADRESSEIKITAFCRLPVASLCLAQQMVKAVCVTLLLSSSDNVLLVLPLIKLTPEKQSTCRLEDFCLLQSVQKLSTSASLFLAHATGNHFPVCF